MSRVAVGVKQAHRHRLHTRGAKPWEEIVHLGERERRALVAVRHEAGGQAQPQRRRDERVGFLERQVVGVVARLPPDLERVLVAGRGDESGRRALALDERIGNEGRAVDDVAHVARRHAGPGEGSPHGVEDTRRRLLRGGQNLLHHGAGPARVEEHDVGERSSDVNRQIPLRCARSASQIV